MLAGYEGVRCRKCNHYVPEDEVKNHLVEIQSADFATGEVAPHRLLVCPECGNYLMFEFEGQLLPTMGDLVQ